MLNLKIYQIITYIIRPFFFIFFCIRILNNKEEKGKFYERKGFSRNKTEETLTIKNNTLPL